MVFIRSGLWFTLGYAFICAF